MSLAFDRHRPAGMPENSPAFQRWGRGQQLPSPKGTAEDHCPSRPFGTYPAGHAHPAILVCPSGTGTEPLLLSRTRSFRTPEPHAWIGVGRGIGVPTLPPTPPPSDGERVPFRAGEGASAAPRN